jgi:hypothetical protein
VFVAVIKQFILFSEDFLNIFNQGVKLTCPHEVVQSLLESLARVYALLFRMGQRKPGQQGVAR